MKKLFRILMIEDDEACCYIHQQVIRRVDDVDIVLTEAHDGSEAIRLLQELLDAQQEDLLPDLILLDLNMPYMDGFEFLEAYQELAFKGKDQIVITALTSSLHPRDLVQVQTKGIRYMPKPLTEEKVSSLIEQKLRIVSDKLCE
jgi:CheY-like chemotaxis protein